MNSTIPGHSHWDRLLRWDLVFECLRKASNEGGELPLALGETENPKNPLKSGLELMLS